MRNEQSHSNEIDHRSGLHVMKFGGTSVGKVDGIHSIGDIVEHEILNGQLLLVVSALNGTTDELISLADQVQGNRVEEAGNIFSSTILRHFELIQNLKMSDHSTQRVMEQIARIGLKLEYEVFDDRTARVNSLDRIVAFGETLSSAIVEGYLHFRGFRARAIDTKEIVRTDSDYGNARPLWDQTGVNARANLLPLISHRYIPVVAGFCGSDELGESTILQRGGSDLTASLLARELGADRLTLFKEIDGVYDVNPDLYADAVRYESLTFEEADRIAKSGNKVLAPLSVEPLIGTNIRMEVRSTFDHRTQGTVISA